MARTHLFGALTRALRASGAGLAPPALSRRQFLVMTAALAACKPIPHASAAGPIAIIGAGAAGLTLAYRLSKAGRRVTLYEASDRVGGRMFTKRDFNADGQFCELGGELVDTNHAALRDLAAELNVPIDRLAPQGEPGEELYHIGQRLYAQHDMLDPRTGTGAFAQLAARIATDQTALLDSEENWTDRAQALDATSLKAYLDSLGNYAPAWALQVLDIAYLGEFGIPTAEQSALNLIDFIGADVREDFRMFGDSDEAFRIRGGSSTLTDALAAQLGGEVERKMRHALVSIAKRDDAVQLVFDSPAGRVEASYPQIALALPFTKLRTIAGIETLGLEDIKLRAIRELGYGDNAKLMVSTQSRPWKAPERNFPAPSGGTFYSDRFQVVWETSRAQPGARGVLTNFLASQQSREAALQNLSAGLEALSPEIAASLEPATLAWMPWARQPYTLGSYASAKIGQYTTLLEETAAPSPDGRIHFAGEHTSVDFLGFMNGAVESGERVAAALLER